MMINILASARPEQQHRLARSLRIALHTPLSLQARWESNPRALEAKLILEINSLTRRLKPSRSVTSRLNPNGFSYLGLLAVSAAIQRHAGK